MAKYIKQKRLHSDRVDHDELRRSREHFVVRKVTKNAGRISSDSISQMCSVGGSKTSSTTTSLDVRGGVRVPVPISEPLKSCFDVGRPVFDWEHTKVLVADR